MRRLFASSVSHDGIFWSGEAGRNSCPSATNCQSLNARRPPCTSRAAEVRARLRPFEGNVADSLRRIGRMGFDEALRSGCCEVTGGIYPVGSALTVYTEVAIAVYAGAPRVGPRAVYTGTVPASAVYAVGAAPAGYTGIAAPAVYAVVAAPAVYTP